LGGMSSPNRKTWLGKRRLIILVYILNLGYMLKLCRMSSVYDLGLKYVRLEGEGEACSDAADDLEVVFFVVGGEDAVTDKEV